MDKNWSNNQSIDNTLDNSFYHSLVNNLPNFIYILRKDMHGVFTFVSNSFCKLLEKQPSEIIGKTDFDIYSQELANKYRHDDEKVIRLKKTIEATEINEYSGKRRYVQVVKVPLFEPNNNDTVIGIQSIFWDETKWFESEQKLKNQQSLLQQLMDMSADCIYFKDLDSHFFRVSQSMLHFYGLNNQFDIIGKSDADFFAPEHAKKTREDEQKIIQTGTQLIGKVEHEIWQDGKESYALSNKAPLKDEQGNIIGTFGISKDITKLKQAEEGLKQARDEAIEATRLKAEFLANMSHEIRTP